MSSLFLSFFLFSIAWGGGKPEVQERRLQRNLHLRNCEFLEGGKVEISRPLPGRIKVVYVSPSVFSHRGSCWSKTYLLHENEFERLESALNFKTQGLKNPVPRSALDDNPPEEDEDEKDSE